MKATKVISSWAVTLAFLFPCLYMSSCKAFAQRTMNGQGLISAGVESSLLRLSNIGGNVRYGQYLLGGYWQVGASVMKSDVQTNTITQMDFIEVNLCGGYMNRLLATRSRSVCLYAGGDAFLGYEIYDPTDDLPSSIDTGLPSGTFIYGVSPQILAEFFLTGKLALTAGCSLPVNFSSPITKVRPNLTLGLRMNI